MNSHHPSALTKPDSAPPAPIFCNGGTPDVLIKQDRVPPT